MKSKKVMSLMITAALLASYAPYAFAKSASEVKQEVKLTENVKEEKAAKISKEKAKEIAKKMLKDNFNIQVDDKKFTYNIEFRGDYMYPSSKYVWEIRWNSNTNLQNINAWVSVDADKGTVLNANVNKYEQGKQQSIASITPKEAAKLAIDFIKKVAPREYKELETTSYSPVQYRYDLVNYNFVYRRKLNGIPFEGNSIRIQVNGATGDIVGYSYTWDDNVQELAKDEIVDLKKAKEVLENNNTMDLSYRLYREKYDYYSNGASVKLMYSPNFKNGDMVDAKTGKITSYNPLNNEKPLVKDLNDKEKEEFYKKAVPFKNFEKELEKEEAEVLLRDKVKEFFGESYEIQNISYRDYSNEYDYYAGTGKVWSAYVTKKGENGYKGEGGNIEINALNGAIISLSRYYDYFQSINGDVKLTQEQAYNKAIEIIAKYYPDKIKDIRTEQTLYETKEIVNGKEIPGRNYYFNFPRVANGIVFMDNNISININAVTGEILEMHSMWNENAQFPKVNGIISEKEAKELYFNKFTPELVYTNINANKDPNETKPEVKLVYKLRAVDDYGEFANIDAFTGRYLDYEGAEINDNLEIFNGKIKGNKYEKELSILARNGILDTKDFEINKEVTKMDIIKMLVNAKGYRPYMLGEAAELKFKSSAQVGDANYKYLQMAVLYGIIDNTEGEINLDEKITREKLAEILVKALGYEKLAKAESIFALPNKDAKEVSANMKGYVAIAQGLNIMDLKDNNFRPKNNTTIVEAALAVYNSLDNLQRILY
ncbi:hypothetical protein GOM49_03335 [Clostridium bovifaecis]|uniref:SLH domain-containing protein n=1 Tax=Clostridium bovifaecis TaxID=2184719 RepID=A0A6I6F9B0_9CLOT|nr:hypothetical protein GOM49_03335 [Clostridium bovifaecis]